MGEHHADFAVPITHRLWIETNAARRSGGKVRGYALALGWWVDPDQTDASQSTGTLYLIVDERGGPPVWIAEGEIVRCEIRD